MKNTETQQPTVLTAEAASKKEYIAPAIEVIELERQPLILAASGATSNQTGLIDPDDYTAGGDPTGN